MFLFHTSDRCMLNTIDGPSESVEDYLCDPEEMPLGARESRLPCPEDCVLNDWGPWSRCSLVRAEPRSERGSSAVWFWGDLGTSDFCEAHWDLSWYLVPVRNIFSEAERTQRGATQSYCERVCESLSTGYFSSAEEESKIYELGCRRKIAYISSVLLCTQNMFSREGTDLWEGFLTHILKPFSTLAANIKQIKGNLWSSENDITPFIFCSKTFI